MGRQEKHEEGVRSLLKRYYYMKERSKYGGDYEAADELADLATAIKQAELTDKQKQAIRKYFVDDEGQTKIAKDLKIGQPRVHDHINAGIRKIAQVYKQWEALDNGL